MADIKVDREIVEGDASQIAAAAGYFCAKALSPTDGKSTISAKGKSIAAFNRGQSGIGFLGRALDTDVANIRSLGVKFEEFDSLMGELSRNGSHQTANENSVE